jgi:hypothetical protein
MPRFVKRSRSCLPTIRIGRGHVVGDRSRRVHDRFGDGDGSACGDEVIEHASYGNTHRNGDCRRRRWCGCRRQAVGERSCRRTANAVLLRRTRHWAGRRRGRGNIAGRIANCLRALRLRGDVVAGRSITRQRNTDSARGNKDGTRTSVFARRPPDCVPTGREAPANVARRRGHKHDHGSPDRRRHTGVGQR